MSLLDRILGRKTELSAEREAAVASPSPVSAHASDEDRLAVERYERMLRTAPTDAIERAHVEAFERLTPSQLDLLFERFDAAATTPEDRPADARPASLARSAARVEARQPGALARIFGGDASELWMSAWMGSVMIDAVTAAALTAALWNPGVGIGYVGPAAHEGSGAWDLWDW